MQTVVRTAIRIGRATMLAIGLGSTLVLGPYTVALGAGRPLQAKDPWWTITSR